MPGDIVLSKVVASEKINDRDIDLLISSRRSVLSLWTSARAESDLGLALLIKARATPDQQEARALINTAIGALHRSLSEAPARPYAWTRLAYAKLLTEGPSSVVADALHMAMMTAPTYGPPYNDGMLAARASLCLVMLPYFSPDDRSRAIEQVRLAWHQSREDMIRLLIETNSIPLLANVFRDDPDELRELKRLRLL